MKYRVVYTEQASRELEESAVWWAENRDREEAARWYLGFSDRILGLSELPHSLALADENDDFPYEIRQLNYGISSRPTHRAIFTIIEPDIVLVLTIRHAARDRIGPSDVDEPSASS